MKWETSEMTKRLSWLWTTSQRKINDVTATKTPIVVFTLGDCRLIHLPTPWKTPFLLSLAYPIDRRRSRFLFYLCVGFWVFSVEYIVGIYEIRWYQRSWFVDYPNMNQTVDFPDQIPVVIDGFCWDNLQNQSLLFLLISTHSFSVNKTPLSSVDHMKYRSCDPVRLFRRHWN